MPRAGRRVERHRGSREVRGRATSLVEHDELGSVPRRDRVRQRRGWCRKHLPVSARDVERRVGAGTDQLGSDGGQVVDRRGRVVQLPPRVLRRAPERDRGTAGDDHARVRSTPHEACPGSSGAVRRPSSCHWWVDGLYAAPSPIPACPWLAGGMTPPQTTSSCPVHTTAAPARGVSGPASSSWIAGCGPVSIARGTVVDESEVAGEWTTARRGRRCGVGGRAGEPVPAERGVRRPPRPRAAAATPGGAGGSRSRWRRSRRCRAERARPSR